MEAGKLVTLSVTFAIGLVLMLIIGFTITSTLTDVESDLATSTRSIGVVNESGNINQTGYTLSVATLDGFSSATLTALHNNTDGTVIVLGNASVNSTGVVTNATEYVWSDALISYNYDLVSTTQSASDLTSNFTTGIDNVSAKIPTIFLVAAVIIILVVLMILWSFYQRMKVGGKGEGGMSGGL